jgi:hypothetical protein
MGKMMLDKIREIEGVAPNSSISSEDSEKHYERLKADLFKLDGQAAAIENHLRRSNTRNLWDTLVKVCMKNRAVGLDIVEYSNLKESIPKMFEEARKFQMKSETEINLFISWPELNAKKAQFVEELKGLRLEKPQSIVETKGASTSSSIA